MRLWNGSIGRATLAGLVLASCQQYFPQGSNLFQESWVHEQGPREPFVIQGILGGMQFDELLFEVDGLGTVEGDDDPTLPMLGFSIQHPVSFGRFHFGLEGGSTFSWESDRHVVTLDDGSQLLVSDHDYWIVDVFAGMYVNYFVNRKMRVYVGAGPLFNWGGIDLELDDEMGVPTEYDEDGVGFGGYARAGIEFEIMSGTFAGFGARWVDADISLGDELTELDYTGLQIALTVTAGF